MKSVKLRGRMKSVSLVLLKVKSCIILNYCSQRIRQHVFSYMNPNIILKTIDSLAVIVQVCILGVSREQIPSSPSSLLHPPSLLPIHSQSKRRAHPLSLSCCHGNHHCVANGESQKKVQVWIHLPAAAVAAAAALCPANLLKQLPVWNHLSFL